MHTVCTERRTTATDFYSMDKLSQISGAMGIRHTSSNSESRRKNNVFAGCVSGGQHASRCHRATAGKFPQTGHKTAVQDGTWYALISHVAMPSLVSPPDYDSLFFICVDPFYLWPWCLVLLMRHRGLLTFATIRPYVLWPCVCMHTLYVYVAICLFVRVACVHVFLCMRAFMHVCTYISMSLCGYTHPERLLQIF
jgi:hypothetical protein